MTHDTSLGHERLHHDMWGNDSPRHANAPAGGPCKQLAPTRALMRVCPLHSHPINIISNSSTRKFRPRHSSTPYDEL
jgi:hypothetical protein